MANRKRNGCIQEIDDIDLKIIEMMLDGYSQVDIAKAVGINRQNVWARRQKDYFKREFDRCKTDRVNTVKNKLNKNAEICVDELIRLLKDEETTNSDKVKILTYVIDHAVGKSTTKVEVSETEDTNDADIDDIDSYLDDLIEEDNKDK